MAEKRRGLGKGLGALIPTASSQGRPIDVFFADQKDAGSRTPDAEPADGATQTIVESPTNDAPRPTAKAGAGDTAQAARGSTTTGDAEAKTSKATTGGTKRTSSATAGTRSKSAGTSEESGTGRNEAVADATDDRALRPVPGATFAEIPVDDIVANRRQPRQVFDEEDLDELASSIREVGVLQPIVVRELRVGDVAGYELIMGERRWRASRLAGNATVPAIIRDTEDTDLLRDALLENLHRAQLNPLEEAAAYSQLLEDFGCTHDELAARIARSRPQISNTLRLLKLPPLVQRRVAAGVLSAGHARALLGLSDGGAMERLAQRIVSEGLSVRTTEEIVALGDEPVQPEMRRRPRAGEYSAELNDLAGRLSDTFDTRVKVALGQRKGRINIEFATMEDLNRILGVLAPSVPRVPTQAND